MQDLKRLATLAYPGNHGKATDLILLHAFVNALSDRKLAFHIRQQEVESIDQAYSQAIKYQAYREMCEEEEADHRHKPYRNVRGTTDETPRSIPHF